MKMDVNSVKRCGVDLSNSEWGLVTGFCKHGNETCGSTRERKFLD
jgi:hypothetical protein